MRLLIVEDNRRMAALLAKGLSGHGFTCDVVHSLAGADAALASAGHDAIILDLGLPDGDGQDWLVARRRREVVPRGITPRAAGTPPALILTARSGLEDRVAGLDAGADDYVVKPVEIDELAARIRALLRRPGQRLLPVIEVGALHFDTASRQVHGAGQPLELSRRETDLLELLMRRAGSVVARSGIENTLYGFAEPVTPNAVEAVISRLRRKLDDAGLGDYLHTIRGVGYMLRDTSR